MKYKIFLFLFAFAASFPAVAEIVSPEEALRVATDFFNSSKEIQTLGTARTLKEIWDSSRLSQGGVNLLSSEAPTFYVFAPETGKGFVIVSAEDAMPPILGYSFEDEAPIGELPCNVRFWFEAMHNQIIQIRAEGKVATMKVKQRWAKESAWKEVFIVKTAKWYQEEPYNLQCPLGSNGTSHCLTGCVQTALAIIMKYHEWPERGQGETEAYTTSSYGIYVEGRNLDHKYDWNNMLLEYHEDEYSDEEAYAVSTLMADLGSLFQADYGLGETSSSPTRIVSNNFDEYFDYSSTMYFPFSWEYTDEEWLQLLKTELRRNGPVLYRGSLQGTLIGHAFVLDGYTDDNYFHINWGLDNYTNGFYLLTEMNYTTNQAALLNFKPNKEDYLINELCDDAEEMLDATWRNITISCADVSADYSDSYGSLSEELENLKQEAEVGDRLTEEQSEEIKQKIEEIVNATRDMHKAALQAENEYLYDIITIEINDVNSVLNDAWNIITTSYADVAAEYKENYNVISSELDELSQNVKNVYSVVQLSKEAVEYTENCLETIRQEIENLLNVSKASETNYLYETLNTEINETRLLLNDTWNIVTTEYADVAEYYRGDYDSILNDLDNLFDKLEEAYTDDTLSKDAEEEMRRTIEEIRQKIEELLAVAEATHNNETGVESVFLSDIGEEIQIYTLSGIRIETPTKGNVYIVYYSDGTVKKVLVK